MKLPERNSSQLSPGEFELMSLLWEHGPLTISGVHQALDRQVGYTTVQTRLNRLVAKGLASRSAERPARYQAVLSADRATASRLDQLVDLVTGGNVVPLVAQLVDDRQLTAQELGELKEIIRAAEQRLAGDESPELRGGA